MSISENTEKDAPDRVNIDHIIAELEATRQSLLASEAKMAARLDSLDPAHRTSARNLVDYLALRRRDIRKLQEDLAMLGLSSLGRAEAHVMATLDAVVEGLHGLAGHGWTSGHISSSFREGKELLEQHTCALLGNAPPGRLVRIMVTMPNEAASNYALVKGLLAAGMDCMRINCAYDDADAWARMIEHLAHARQELGKECRLAMDLAGPKLRVGSIEPGPEIIKIRPRRDVRGVVTEPAMLWLVPATRHEFDLPVKADAVIPVSEGNLSLLSPGEVIEFIDARRAHRGFTVSTTANGCTLVEARHTAYLMSGTEMKQRGSDTTLKVGVLPALKSRLILKRGDRLILTGEPSLGRDAELDEHGQVIRAATITCNMPQILQDLRAGHKIWFDDGKIGGVIKRAGTTEAEIEITQARPSGGKLAENKGINLPDTDLRVPCFTPKDLEDLPFLAAHADIIEMSFVRRPQDVSDLRAKIARMTNRSIGIVLKIEARKAFENLPDLVFEVMKHPTAGVMIARGDLAVECGYERLAEVQEEILWICEAAHLPVIWATQVLESFAKTGQPSRAEITDAAMGERAECVMLNKGPYIIEAVASLDNILRRMQAHQIKKTAMLRRLRW